MTTKHSWYTPQKYQIKFKCVLGIQWRYWFEGMTIESRDGMTILTGKVADQAGLHGLLGRIRDMGLTLISEMLIESAR